jgi:hypothetical protein
MHENPHDSRKHHVTRNGDNLKSETPPITIYLSQHFPINVLEGKGPVP